MRPLKGAPNLFDKTDNNDESCNQPYDGAPFGQADKQVVSFFVFTCIHELLLQNEESENFAHPNLTLVIRQAVLVSHADRCVIFLNFIEA